MIPILQSLIEDAIAQAQAEPKSREIALVLTKLEEALMWFKARK